MGIEFTQDELSQLATADDESLNSKPLADKLRRMCSEIERKLLDQPLLEEFNWTGSPGSPYVGPPNPESSDYLWVGLAHEIYKEQGKPSTGLQFEFGFDCGASNGFFDRDVICGLYFGPWSNEEVTEKVTTNFTEHASVIADFLSTHPNYTLQTKSQKWDQPDTDSLVENVDVFAEGFTLTVELSIPDICAVDINGIVYASFDELLSLYLLLAGGQELYNKCESKLTEVIGLSEDTSFSTLDSLNGDSPGDENHGVALTVESITEYSSLIDREDIESNLENLYELGASREEALDKFRQYAIDMKTGEGLYAITGLGPISGYALSKAGITNVEDFKTYSLDELKAIEGLRSGQVELIYSNINTSGDQTDPVDTSDEKVETLEDEEIKKKEIFANPLSEYYEALRGVRKVIGTLMQMSGVDIDPDDLTDPRVQYYVVVDAILVYGGLQVRFAGYGPQHQDRLSFNIDNYREVFGNGQWVSEYNTIEVVPYHDETKEWLRDNTWLNRTAELVRPVGPTSEYPLPEIVETKDELRFALKILGELPVYPPLPTETGTVERTIPISALYSDVLSDVPDGFLVDFDTDS